MIKKLSLILCSCLLLCSTICMIACEGLGGGDGEQPTDEKYVVTFYDENGLQLESKEWRKGTVPSCEYLKTEDDFYIYEFKGWALTQNGEILTSLPMVNGDVSYYAIVTKTDKLTALKNLALEQLSVDLDGLISNITDENLRASVTTFKNQEIAKIQAINSLDALQPILAEITQETATFIQTTLGQQLSILKTAALEQLSADLDLLIAKISDETLRSSITTFKNAEIAKINAITSLDTAQATLQIVAQDTVTFIQTTLGQQLSILKTAALEQLSADLDTLIDKITDNELRADIATFKNTEITKINSIESLENIQNVLTEVEQDTATFIQTTLGRQLSKLKTETINELNAYVDTALSKITSQQLRNELNDFYAQQIQLIEQVNSLDGAVSTFNQIVENLTDYAIQLVASQTQALRETVSGYITALVNSMAQGPSSYIPNKMKAGNNLVDLNDVIYDFSNFVDVADITYGGFGEQWNMVLTNLEESQKFFNVLNATDSVFGIALGEINDYLLSNYAESVNFSADKENYSIDLTFTDNILVLSIVYKTGLNNSFFGDITPSITMTFDTVNNEKEVEISLSTNNALRYTVTDTKYEFAITYGVSVADRTAYCSFERTSATTVEGHIYEYLTIGDISTNSCADFYIGNDYVSVVGNKASGMIGFSGFINELYKTNEGKLLGYEVREEMTFAGVTGTYNTVWFNLDDISGITNVKVLDHDLGDEKNKNDIYINGSSDIFTPAYNSKFFVQTSRKFDIELRKQYFYYLDDEENLCKVEVEVPMMFIQEDNENDTNYSDYPTDVLEKNGITSTVIINSTVLNKILADYDTLIDVFVENKDNISSNTIKDFIQG